MTESHLLFWIALAWLLTVIILAWGAIMDYKKKIREQKAYDELLKEDQDDL